MTSAITADRLFACLALCLAACQDLPEIRYKTAHLHIATEFDEPLCAGNLAHMERIVTTLEQQLDTRVDAPIEVYLWDPQRSEAPDWCPDDYNLGCYESGTVRTDPIALDHELVHAVVATMGSPAPFWSEGTAEALQSERTLLASSSTPIDNLELGPPELSYLTAGHFSRWLFEVHGAESYRQLLRAKGDAREAFEATYGFSFEAAQEQFYEAAPHSYGALVACEYPELEQVTDKAWSENLEIDCARSDVHSTPLGMGIYRVVEISERGYYEIFTSAELGIIARCENEDLDSPPMMNPQAWGDVPPITDGFIYQYSRALPGAGEITTLDLAPGRYEIAIGGSSFDPTTATLDVRAAPP